MRTTFWTWVDDLPDGFSHGKVWISGKAVLILAGASVLAFCATVGVLLMFP